MYEETVERVVDVVAETAPEVRAGLPGRRTTVGEENPSDELQLAADVWADEMLESRLTAIDGVGAYASEERETVVEVDAGGDDAAATGGDGLAVAVDPLDGSSNLKSNNSMGTIFAVSDAPLPASGRHLVAAGFVLYGPITTMTVAVDGEVTEYVVEDDGSRRPVRESLALPEDPVVYGFGGRVPAWTDGFTAYARVIESELKLRYGGAMIGDLNQVLTYGGVFSYPGLRDRPEGKLRLQFEGAPMAYLVESAGGASSNGEGSLLDVDPDGLHERTPVHLGNEDLINRLETTLAEHR